MSTPQSIDDLFKLIRKSGLVEEQKLVGFYNTHQRDGLLEQDARKVVATMVREGLITYFQGEQFLLGKWRGFTLGKFKLLERIGVGGMGQVFLCEHTYMRRRMAVKVLPPTKAEDPVALGRFYREARVASALEHPNIVRTFDIDQDGPLHFLVMEYVDGTSLLDIVKKFGPLSVARACHYIRQACLGLQQAFSAGMVHRDIKPGNIMVDRAGHAKLLDMGLARFYRDEKDQLTLKYDDKNVLGTADYVAPEQTRDSRNIDIRADIYGMGATFYYVLTGQPPFPEATVAEKLIAHQTKKPRPVRELRAEVPAGVSKIIEKMMAKDPKDRFQTPKEVTDALEVWTREAIDPPSAEEMPKLSPAAMDPSYSPGTAEPPPAPVRDGATVRPEVPARNRSVSSPMFQMPDITPAMLEDAKTVPVPPQPRPAVAMAPGSIVDLLVPAPPAPSAPAARPAGPALHAETQPLVGSTDPTPQPTPKGGMPPAVSFGFDAPLRRPGTLPDVKLPGADLDATPAKKAPLRPSALGMTRPLPPQGLVPPVAPAPPPATSRPTIDLPKLRSFQGMSNPGIELTPGGTPLLGSGPPPGFAPRPPAADKARPPSLEGFRIPLPPAAPPPARLPRDIAPPRPSPSKAPRIAPISPPPLSITPAPTYKPPTMMPFFDQPIVQAQPNAFVRFLRWLLMIAISSMIGAGLGVAIWYQFLRRPG